MGMGITQLGTDQYFSDNSWNYLLAVPCASNDAIVFADATIMARRPSTGDCASWQLKAFFRKDGTDPVQLVGSVISAITPQKTVGALLWDVRVTLNSDDYVYFQCKGASGSQVDWTIYGTMCSQAS